MKFAAHRQVACTEDIDLRTSRGIDRAVKADRINGGRIDPHEKQLITVPTDLGKSWIGRAIGHKACATAALLRSLAAGRHCVGCMTAK